MRRPVTPGARRQLFPGAARAGLVVLAAGLVLGVGPAAAQVSPGWYVIPSLSVSEEFDDNVFGRARGRESDFITRISPSITAGYQSIPLTALVSYALGAEVFADHSELSGVNQHRVGLDLRYLPEPRLTLTLGAAYNRTESTTTLLGAPTAPEAPAPGPPPPEAPPAEAPPPEAPPAPPVPGVEIGRRVTQQVSVSPAVSYRLDPLTTVSGRYAFSRSDVEDGPVDNQHTLGLSVSRQLTRLDRASASYTFRLFDPGGEGDAGRKTQSSHALTLGYGRQLTERLDASVEAGPRITDEGDVDAEARASLSYRFRTAAVSLTYVRTQGIVTGRAGAQTTDTLAASAVWTPLRELSLALTPSVQLISAEDGRAGSRDTVVYTVAAGAAYRLTEWLVASLRYAFSLQDEEDAPDIRRHSVLLTLSLVYPVRVY